MYFDTCYIAKFYLNEADSSRVRGLVLGTNFVHSSTWALAEFHAVLHRQMREGWIPRNEAHIIASRFSEHLQGGLWKLVPVTEGLLRRTATMTLSAPNEMFLRAADAVHLATAQEIGEREVWTNDRHMLTAAPYFGLAGRSVRSE